MSDSEEEKATFESLGVRVELREACTSLKWLMPTPIQAEALPHGLNGKDIIGLAQTGSGKTGAFAIPILQALLETPRSMFAVVLAPTRELAFQINEVFEGLGAGIGIKTVVVVGGMDMTQQQIQLGLRPHVIIATPGRLCDHLQTTKGFSLRTVKFLVLDEADQMLNMNFQDEIDKILKELPKERNTYLFSATMTKKVAKLQRASLRDPVRCEVSEKYSTVDTLVQRYLFCPAKYKDCYFVYVVNELAGNSIITFANTHQNVQRLALILRSLGFAAVPLHGQMTQPKRLGALNKFKSGDRQILVATDVASRGLDIPMVDAVINYDLPNTSKEYIHRVGRTARAGRSGRAINVVTQYDVEVFQRIEKMIGKKLDVYPTEEEAVLLLLERVTEAARMAKHEMNAALEAKGNGGRKRHSGGGKRGRGGKFHGGRGSKRGRA